MSDFKYYLKIAGMLFLICSITALIVAAVYGVTNEKIAQNELETMNDSIKEIFGDDISTEKLKYNGKNTDIAAIYEVKEENSIIGYAVHAKPMGFKDSIEMMVGVTPDGICKSVRIISLSETPGLGSKVSEDSFTSGFEGATGVLEIKKDITPVAGATVSSKAVTKGVNSALEAVADVSVLGGGK